MNSNESRARGHARWERLRGSVRAGTHRASLAGGVLLAAACAEAPSTLRPASAPAHRLFVLQWWLIGIALAVMLIIGVLLLVPLRHRIRTVADAPLEEGGSTRPIAIGVVISALILIAVFIYSAVVLAADAKPDTPPKLAVKVIGHRWWWEVQYLNADSSDVHENVIGANEIHIPVGEPVRILGMSADVIHSFWVPQLQGKIDLIPGQTNVFWIRADTAGRYRGQCAEYCGLQHAHMIFWVVAQSRADFDAWLAHARAPAAAPKTPIETEGQQAFLASSCVLCHTVRGTRAGGTLGPDLTHVGSRLTIGAGTLTNTPGNLAGWIENAQSIKPGVDMPRLDLPPATLRQILAYLESLN
ncbi:MAG TPA: cytochrome c oxidase subunit II [Gemmatimonadaceae bacterium]|nr:cytochrome c oxidase subunit II [Gemmatimonadaceae bacterium]